MDAPNGPGGMMPGKGIEALGLNIQLFLDCDPDAFPAGIDLTAIPAGKLVALGTVRVLPGSILFVLDANEAKAVRAHLKNMATKGAALRAVGPAH
jgi:hypothetical protein